MNDTSRLTTFMNLSKKIIETSYHTDGSKKPTRYYKQIAINRTIEAVANGQNRIILVMGRQELLNEYYF